MFLPPNFFGGGPPKFWDLDYKTEEPSDQLAQYRGDRPTELGDLALKRRKTSAHLELLYRSGWPNNEVIYWWWLMCCSCLEQCWLTAWQRTSTEPNTSRWLEPLHYACSVAYLCLYKHGRPEAWARGGALAPPPGNVKRIFLFSICSQFTGKKLILDKTQVIHLSTHVRNCKCKIQFAS